MTRRQRAEVYGPDVRWAATLQDLTEWVALKSRFPGPPEGRLGRWLHAQQKYLDKGKLAPERRAALDAALPGWDAGIGTSFDAHVAQLAAFWKKHNRMPQRCEGALGVWAAEQVERHAANSLPEARRQALDAAVPEWLAYHERQWHAALQQLGDYMRERGRMPEWKEGPLTTWVVQQRVHLRVGKLTDERRAALDAAAPGWWDAEAAWWHFWLCKLQDFVGREGRLPMRSYKRELRLWTWVLQQKRLRMYGKLPEARGAALDRAVPGWSLTRKEKKALMDKAAAAASAEPADANTGGDADDDDVKRALAWEK